MINVFIADDHAIVRKGLVQIIQETDHMRVVGEAAHGQAVLDTLGKADPDILLLDIKMPGGTGLDILQQIRRVFPRVKVLILTIYPEEQYAFRAMKLGASGYLTKDSAPEELVSAIEKINRGGKYITQSLAETLAAFVDEGVDKPLHETLSNREYQVMIMLSRGKTVSQIAQEMCLSVKTVSTYRTRLLQKMKIRDNADITAYVISCDLLD